MAQGIIDSYRQAAAGLHKNEVWRNVDFSAQLTDDMVVPTAATADANLQFWCNIQGLEAHRVAFVNGAIKSNEQSELVRSAMTEHCLAEQNGAINSKEKGDHAVVCCTVAEARRDYPELLDKALSDVATDGNPYAAINGANATDGLFLYVPDGVAVQQPLQLLSIANSDKSLLLHLRHVVVLGRGSSLKLIQCDDSYTQQGAFSNNVLLASLGEGSRLEHYKMQNLNDATALLNQTFVSMQRDASLCSVGVTLNGGNIRNHNVVRMTGEGCSTEVHGLYLIDRQQRCDNYVFVDHLAPHCKSHELYKGILDDSAHGVFNGHVLVRDGAVKTEAYQANRNILLTDKAFVQSKPFLEIYNDDVKCSHGTTTGQLDSQALFYLMQRGISQRSARTLLLYAFCDEVLRYISIEQLRDKLADMVKKRLHGELSACVDCALSCSNSCGCTPPEFTIDPEKL